MVASAKPVLTKCAENRAASRRQKKKKKKRKKKKNAQRAAQKMAASAALLKCNAARINIENYQPKRHSWRIEEEKKKKIEAANIMK